MKIPVSLYPGKRLLREVGLTGTSKATLITSICSKFPKGVLYFEVLKPVVFTRKLAQEVAMKIDPSYILI